MAPDPLAEADHVFRACARRAARGGSRVAPLAPGLLAAADRLHEPLRLALVGQIKRGKSTLVNALLGERLADTGQLELTFTVSEFCYGAERNVYVHYKDGTAEGPLPPEALRSLTVRDPRARAKLERIHDVEYTMPNELLRTFRLVDTPGLGSVYGADSRNSLDYLGVGADEFAAVFDAAFADDEERRAARSTLTSMGRSAADLHTASIKQAVSADAVVYLFSRGLHPADLATIVRFLGPAAGSITPLRAFGVLSRCDEYWPAERDLGDGPAALDFDPMATAAAVADRYLADPAIAAMFASILPVAGLVAIGAMELTAAEFGWLEELSKVEPAALLRSLRDIGRFARAAELPGICLPPDLRRQLVARLGGWGTHLACAGLRQQLGADAVRASLLERSGLLRLRRLISEHFGNRSTIIKLDRGLQDAKAEIGRRRQEIRLAGAPIPPALDDIARGIEQLQVTSHGAAELAALSRYYKGEVGLTGELARDLLTVTGAAGLLPAARLGLTADATREELATVAARQAAKWSNVVVDPVLDHATRSVARTVRTSYELLLHQVTGSPGPFSEAYRP